MSKALIVLSLSYILGVLSSVMENLMLEVFLINTWNSVRVSMQLLELSETQLPARFPETETRDVHDGSKIFSFSRKMDPFWNERQLQDTRTEKKLRIVFFHKREKLVRVPFSAFHTSRDFRVNHNFYFHFHNQPLNTSWTHENKNTLRCTGFEWRETLHVRFVRFFSALIVLLNQNDWNNPPALHCDWDLWKYFR